MTFEQDNFNNLEEENIFFNEPVIEDSSYQVRVNYLYGVNIRAESNIDSNILRVAPDQEILTISKEKNGFGKLKNENGWIKLQYTIKV